MDAKQELSVFLGVPYWLHFNACFNETRFSELKITEYRINLSTSAVYFLGDDNTWCYYWLGDIDKLPHLSSRLEDYYGR